ncbi:MAG TPA: bifunctional 5,10-methylenetetrahydrofolate dehydrogenase/5,10-methenyltetrahydrofolate cyclohydrolase [Methylocystis sp.]|jgi:methylenetetrahydrofolate dehydrogenase (NADP+)/methenyltetrahydrofolate cyclohydrolase
MKPIYSKDIVAARKARLIDAFGALKQRGITPKLAAVICAADPAAASYVSVKRKHTEEIGGAFEVVDLSTLGAAKAGSRMKALCGRPDVHGVIVVMSSKPEIDEIELTNLIPANKDVDGLSAANLGMLLQNDPRQFFTAPATPQACIVLAESETELKGKHVVVIGRGRTVGRPLANMLISTGATVTVCHSETTDIPRISQSAEVVFVATGRPRHFGKKYFRDGQLIVDAGIGFIDGQLTGDVDISALAELRVGVTPVPGGVGPLTSVLILENLLNLIEMQSGNESTTPELAAR